MNEQAITIMGILPLFSRLPSRYSDSLSVTNITDRQVSHPFDRSLYLYHKSNQKGPRQWLVGIKSKLNPIILGKKANRNRIFVVPILVIVVGGNFVP